MAALPGGDEAAGTFDDRDKGSDIIGLHMRIKCQIDLARRQNTKEIGIAAIACQPCSLTQTLQHILLCIRPVELRCGGGEGGIGQRSRRPSGELAACSLMERPGPFWIAVEGLANEGLVHDANNGSVLEIEADQG